MNRQLINQEWTFTSNWGKSYILSIDKVPERTEEVSPEPGILRRLSRGYKRGPRKTCCVYNKTRESFLSLNVAVADTHFTRFRGLLGKMRLKTDEGIWVVPSYGVHTFGLPISIDQKYIDSEYRVIDLIESFGSFRIGPMRLNCVSVLELSKHTIYSSQTQVGDELLISSPEKMAEFLKQHQMNRVSSASQ